MPPVPRTGGRRRRRRRRNLFCRGSVVLGYQPDVSAWVSWVREADPLGERKEGLPRGIFFQSLGVIEVIDFEGFFLVGLFLYI